MSMRMFQLTVDGLYRESRQLAQAARVDRKVSCLALTGCRQVSSFALSASRPSAHPRGPSTPFPPGSASGCGERDGRRSPLSLPGQPWHDSDSVPSARLHPAKRRQQPAARAAAGVDRSAPALVLVSCRTRPTTTRTATIEAAILACRQVTSWSTPVNDFIACWENAALSRCTNTGTSREVPVCLLVYPAAARVGMPQRLILPAPRRRVLGYAHPGHRVAGSCSDDRCTRR